MASNRTTTIVIDGDASGVKKAAKVAEGSIDKLSSSVDKQGQNLNRYGEKLGKAFGPGQGLHGRLDNLETPLRDTEGAIARSQMAFVEFGKAGATASDKIGAGFLLAGDAIAAFTSGGAVGIAIAAAVAGFSLIAKVMMDEAAAAEEAAKAQEDHAAALKELGSAAVDAGISIAALNAQEAAAASLANVRTIEQQQVEARTKQKRLKDALDDARDFEKRQTSFTTIQSAKRKLVIASDAAEAQDLIVKNLKDAAATSRTQAKQDQAFYLSDLAISQGSAVTSFVESLKVTKQKATDAIKEISTAKLSGGKAGGSNAGESEEAIMARAAASDKQRTKEQQEQRLEEEATDKRFDARAAERAKAKSDFEEKSNSDMLAAIKVRSDARTAAADKAAAQQQKAQAMFMKTHAVEIAATRAIIGGLQQMAHDGEISFAALGDAAMTAAGNQLVASGTEHLLGGAAKAFAGAATFNPVMVAGGTAEAGQGALMIAAGLGLGAVGGAIGRSGSAPAAPSGASAPTDSRESRAASGGSGGEGGSTIINFNGPAFDRRGVSNIITSGNRMARHRRIAGA